jgi:hypothetical protein
LGSRFDPRFSSTRRFAWTFLPAVAYMTDGRFCTLGKVARRKIALPDTATGRPRAIRFAGFLTTWISLLILMMRRALSKLVRRFEGTVERRRRGIRTAAAILTAFGFASSMEFALAATQARDLVKIVHEKDLSVDPKTGYGAFAWRPDSKAIAYVKFGTGSPGVINVETGVETEIPNAQMEWDPEHCMERRWIDTGFRLRHRTQGRARFRRRRHRGRGRLPRRSQTRSLQGRL